MNDIRDISLAPSGHDKINWVKSFMPVLNRIRDEFIEKKPLAGRKIAMSIHLEAKTAYLATVLRDGGAEVYATGCNSLSTQDDVAAALSQLGVNVFAVHGDSPEDYTKHLVQTLSCVPDLIIDDGGDFTELLHTTHRELGKNLLGGCEETTTGIHRLRIRQQKGILDYPMININDADCKHLFDNRYGTGQSTLDAIMHCTNLVIAGKTAVVAGYGWCGKGISMRLKGMGANVIVTEIDAVKALEACMDGFAVMKMTDAAPLGDLFITATGCDDVITKEHIEKMKDNVLLSNSGHFNVEINLNHLADLSERIYDRKPNIKGYVLKDGRTVNLLAEGKLVNLAAGNGHPAEIMDMSFSLQAKCLAYIASLANPLPKALISVPTQIDAEVATLKLSSMGRSIDTLTDAQKQYLGI